MWGRIKIIRCSTTSSGGCWLGSTRTALSFLIVGHTKFSPDWCFGLLKQHFPRTRVACLSDMESVNSSAEANVAQLVETQSGEVVVPTYNWTAMFAGRLRKLKHMKKFQHLSISESAPGSVDVRIESDSEIERFSLLMDPTWTPSSQQLPLVVSPSGLSLEQQWYLHSQIREYCPDAVRDKICPQPLTPLSSITTPSTTTPSTIASSSTAASSSLNTAEPTSVGSTQDDPPPPTKRQRKCGTRYAHSRSPLSPLPPLPLPPLPLPPTPLPPPPLPLPLPPLPPAAHSTLLNQHLWAVHKMTPPPPTKRQRISSKCHLGLLMRCRFVGGGG